jgi:peptidoglycan/xylan/chitin deacetylase (PgdA/CDA1 family)
MTKARKVPILMYHMVCENSRPEDLRFTCSPAMFKRQMAHLRRAGYRAIPLSQLSETLRGGMELPEKSVVITFDDGFRDNYLNAFPVLLKYSLPATLFVVSGFVSRTNQWMTRDGFPERNLATWDELREMAANGIEIGSHTVNHIALDTADPETSSREVRISRENIIERIGKPVRFFAYPYGRMNEAVRTAVSMAGYEAACSTRSGFNSTGADPFILRRLEVYGADSLWRFALKIAWGTNDASLATISRYYLTRLKERLI